jgi:CDP-glucose 4,6-dehydratase
MFENIYKSKKVLITGHTGFKGSWLTSWLLKLGAHVVGISIDIPTTPSMFIELELESKIKHIIEDIRNLEKINSIIVDEKPDFIFHLAAQAIVSKSYVNPVDTMSTNIIGTMNILEALRKLDTKCTAIMITSDKCYDNVEWVWGYKETDHMGGKDIYSGSKGAAELVIKSYVNSFFNKPDHPVTIGIGRAGNVIGGGDWASDRIVVDCMKNWSMGRSVEVRSPKATRPWQHVLEPLSGYLTLGMTIYLNKNLHGEAFNFGPKSEQNHTVIDLLKDLSMYWKFDKLNNAYVITDEIPFHEAGLLKLNCDKALYNLKWDSNLIYPETIKLLAEWYLSYYYKEGNMYEKTLSQISYYENIAVQRNKSWTN